MPNYKLKIEYDGTDFAGWQIQNNVPTIQGEIEAVLKQVLQKDVGIIGSGRTDAGVHAFGQVANFSVNTEIDTYKLFNSLNALLPNSIAVRQIEKVSDNFHSRFNACKRSYLYFMNNFKSPFYYKYAHYYTAIDSLSVERLNELSKALTGQYDFTSFSRKNSEIENKLCHVQKIQWRKSNGFLIMLIEADRYLHGMVKTIVGTIIKTAEQNLTEQHIKSILNERDREAAGEAFPSKGLFLYKVRYPIYYK